MKFCVFKELSLSQCHFRTGNLAIRRRVDPHLVSRLEEVTDCISNGIIVVTKNLNIFDFRIKLQFLNNGIRI